MRVTMKCKTWLDAKGVRDAVRQASGDPLFKCAESVRATAIRSMAGGRQSPGEGETPVPVPSSPGSPPNRQTSGLAGSIQVEMANGKRLARVGPTVIYGRIHEFGGKIAVTSKMRGYLAFAYGWHVKKAALHFPARPFMRPALAKARKGFAKFFRDLPLATTDAGRKLNAQKRKGR